MKPAVYTCITSAYDKLHEPRFVSPNIDYICFSDADLASTTWEVRPLHHLGATPRRTARYHKLMSHDVLPEREVTLWVDGAYRIDGDLATLLAVWLENHDLALRRHPVRLPQCAYAEASACLRLRRGEPDAIAAQVAEYRRVGYPERNGVYVTGVLARRHRPAVRAFNEAWWAELERFSDRDQIAFPFVAWKQAFSFKAFRSPDHSHHHRPFLAWLKHARIDLRNP